MDEEERKEYQKKCDVLKFNLSFAMRRTVNLLSENPKDPPNTQNPYIQMFYEFLDTNSEKFSNDVTIYSSALVNKFKTTEEFEKIFEETALTEDDGEIFSLFKAPKKVVDPSYMFLKHFGFRFNNTYYNFDKELFLLFKIEFLFFACTHEEFSVEWADKQYEQLKKQADEFIEISENKENLKNSKSYISILLPTLIVLVGEDLIKFLMSFYENLRSFGNTAKNTLTQHYQNGYEKQHSSTLSAIVSEFLHLVLIAFPFNIIYSVTGIPLRIAQAFVELAIKENDATRSTLVNIFTKINKAITTTIYILFELGVRLALYFPRKLVAFGVGWIIYPILMAPARLLIKPLISKIQAKLHPQREPRELKFSSDEISQIGSMLIRLNLAMQDAALKNPAHTKIFLNNQAITLSEIYNAAQTFQSKKVLLPLQWLNELKNQNNLVFLFQTETTANPIQHVFLGKNTTDALLPKLTQNENCDSIAFNWRLCGEIILSGHFEAIISFISNRNTPLNELFLITRNINNFSLEKISRALLANDKLNPETFSVPINCMSKTELTTLLNLVKEKKSIKNIPLLINSHIDHLDVEEQNLRYKISGILDERKGVIRKPTPTPTTQATTETTLSQRQLRRVLNLFSIPYENPTQTYSQRRRTP